MNMSTRSATGLTLVTAILATLASALLWLPEAAAGEEVAQSLRLEPEVWQFAVIAAALSTSASSVAAAWAVARIGTAAMGTLAEKPELFGRLVIFLGLAEGIAIYGLIVSVLILNRLG
jgi:V/A-type H+-transporting ATPase subunit K